MEQTPFWKIKQVEPRDFPTKKGEAKLVAPSGDPVYERNTKPMFTSMMTFNGEPMRLEFFNYDEVLAGRFFHADPEFIGPVRRSDRHRPDVLALLDSINSIEDLAAAIDLSAFPLPLRVAVAHRCNGWCFCPIVNGKLVEAKSISVYMKVKPRTANEFGASLVGADGLVELHNATEITNNVLVQKGVEETFELLRLAIKNIVMHEVYEAVMVKGVRILDPHNNSRRPKDQPW